MELLVVVKHEQCDGKPYALTTMFPSRNRTFQVTEQSKLQDSQNNPSLSFDDLKHLGKHMRDYFNVDLRLPPLLLTLLNRIDRVERSNPWAWSRNLGNFATEE
jgi:hypothetical protein